MSRKKRIERRQSHGSAWHWKQTDCWYATLPGSKQRVPLFDEAGNRIRGKENKEAAVIALARNKLSWDVQSDKPGIGAADWIVARVCSEYIQHCEKGLKQGSTSRSHRDNAVRWLNDFCSFCGALPVTQLKKAHVMDWVASHTTWHSPNTRRGAITVVQAAFNRAQNLFDVPNPLKGLKRPSSKPRLASISPEDEQVLYAGCEPRFREFLFAALHTGLRPFCELALLTAEHVEEHPRGMMWRVYSTKTKKTRRIPVRPEVAELVRRLSKTAPPGSRLPIFRNTQGKPWKRTNGVVRFIDLRRKLGWKHDPVRSKYSCYTCRHTFAHRMLSGYWSEGVGCTVETLAELLGDTPKVAFDHYGKEWGQHYQGPLWSAIGEPVNSAKGSSGTTKRAPKQKAATSAAKPRKPR